MKHLSVSISLVVLACATGARADLSKLEAAAGGHVLKPQHLSVGFVDPIPGFGGKGCLYSTNAGATVVAGDLGKIEAWHGVQVAAWTGPMAAAPAIAASPLFYGSQQCDKLFVADFQVSNATTKVSAGGKPSSSGPFSPTLLVGDRDRKGQYADLSGI